MSDIDLAPFVSVDPHRPTLHTPWSRGEYTYATNGHVAIRVPRRPDIAINSDAPDCQRLLDNLDLSSLAPVEMPRLPAFTFGLAEDADECEHTTLIHTSVTVFGHLIDLRYAQLLASLPDLHVGIAKSEFDPLPFGSGDAIGCVMGLRAPLARHFDLAARQKDGAS